jgi:hypothetical protein
MRAHFTICPNRPAASGDVDRRTRNPNERGPRRGANAVRLALRRPTHGEPDAHAFRRGPRMKIRSGGGAELTGASCARTHHMPEPFGRLRPRGPAGEEPEVRRGRQPTRRTRRSQGRAIHSSESATLRHYPGRHRRRHPQPQAEARKRQDQLKASLSVAATRARLFGGSKALCPLSGVMMKSASGHSRCSAHALSNGQTTS